MPLTSPLRIPFSWPYNPRNADSTRDPQRLNVMDEHNVGTMDDSVRTLKRPGTALAYSLGAGQGQGITNYNDSTYAVIDDSFVSVTANPNSGTTAATFSASTTPAWAPRYLGNALVFKDRMWILSGFGVAGLPAGDIWSSTDGVTWAAASGSAPWGGRQGFGACVLGNKMYVMGGYGSFTDAPATWLNDVWSSENGTDWVQLVVSDVVGTASTDRWNPRANFGCVASSSGIFVIGGSGPSFLFDDVWYSADGISWARVGGAFGWGNRMLFGCLYYQNKLWIIAGYTTLPLSDVWVSSDGGVSWTQTTAGFAAGRFDSACCVYNNKMWCLGGVGGANYSDVYSSTDGATWSLVTSTPGWTGRAGALALVFRTPASVSTHRYPSIWVLGGNTDAGISNEVWRGDLDTAVGTSIALSPTVASQQYQFNSFQTSTRLLIKNQSNMWVYDSGSITVVTEAGYPTTTVPGIVVLGGSAYVMDPSGLIYNCALDNPYYWPALNVLGADYEDDAGVCLVKYLNYVVAFGTYTTQVFYDAGLAGGSPLRPYLNANMKVGCTAAATVCQVGTTVVWVGQTQQGSRQVMMFNGLTPQPISTPAIDKILTSQLTPSSMRAFCFSANGHVFYVLNGAHLASRALVYDFSIKNWYEWEHSIFAGFDYLASADLHAVTTYLLHPTNGNIYAAGTTLYDDDGSPFTVYLRTKIFDADIQRKKFWGRLDLVGDQNPGLLNISFSDDDGQTYSLARQVNMNNDRPALFRNGASRRRLFVASQTDSNPMGLESFEQQFEIGT